MRIVNVFLYNISLIIYSGLISSKIIQSVHYTFSTTYSVVACTLSFGGHALIDRTMARHILLLAVPPAHPSLQLHKSAHPVPAGADEAVLVPNPNSADHRSLGMDFFFCTAPFPVTFLPLHTAVAPFLYFDNLDNDNI